MRFSEEQVEEIEDRVMNLIQGPFTAIEMALNGEEVPKEYWQSSMNSLRRLSRWVQSLRPEERRWRS